MTLPDTTEVVAQRIGQYLEHLPVPDRTYVAEIAIAAHNKALEDAGVRTLTSDEYAELKADSDAWRRLLTDYLLPVRTPELSSYDEGWNDARDAVAGFVDLIKQTSTVTAKEQTMEIDEAEYAELKAKADAWDEQRASYETALRDLPGHITSGRNRFKRALIEMDEIEAKHRDRQGVNE